MRNASILELRYWGQGLKTASARGYPLFSHLPKSHADIDDIFIQGVHEHFRKNHVNEFGAAGFRRPLARSGQAPA